jgi:hypothetical protein
MPHMWQVLMFTPHLGPAGQMGSMVPKWAGDHWTGPCSEVDVDH